jgi:hypothetical protein
MSRTNRPLVAAGLLLGLCAVAAATIAAQNYPHAFPRKGVTKLFENERVVAWDVKWVRDVEQPVHRHQFDMAAVYTVYGPIRVTAPDGVVSPQSPPFEVPRPFFQPKGVTHKEEAIGFPGAPEREAVMFDLKDVSFPQVTRPGMLTAFPREGARKAAIDNDRVREWDYTWQPGKLVPMHIHDRDSVEVFFDPGTIRYKTQDGKEESRTFKRKDTRWIPRGTMESEEAISGTPRAVTIELK